MSDPSESRRRVRFSISTLVLLTTIAALAITVYLQWREVGPLRAEVKRLRSEAGVLVVDDPAKFKAMAVRTLGDKEWSYRVYLPKGGEYTLAWKLNGLPANGVPVLPHLPRSSSSAVSWDGNLHALGVSGGEKLVTFALEEQPDGTWRVGLTIKDSGHELDLATAQGRLVDGAGTTHTRGMLPIAESEWPNEAAGILRGGGGDVGDSWVEAPTNRPLVLLDLRFQRPTSRSGTSRSYEYSDVPPSEGVMLWIVDNDAAEPHTGP